MAHAVAVYQDSPLTLTDGRIYTAQASGRQRSDGTWEGWLEFIPNDNSVVLRSQRETTQPNLTALEYWAGGLTPVYLKGALERTLTAPPVVVEPPVLPSVYDEPAPAVIRAVELPPEPEPVLNPFSVFAKGEDLLRQQLAALSPRHLRAIIVGYDLADLADVDLDALTDQELIEIIVVEVRGRLAA
jgi:hypothetical protein